MQFFVLPFHYADHGGSVVECKGHWFETHKKYCVLSLNSRLFPLLSTGSTQEDGTCPDLTEKLLTGV